LILFILVLLVAFARVNTHIESDSSWYALYVDRNLFGENSFYDFLGYTGFIYYYPKFKELLFAPLSGLGIPGYLIAPNIWIMLLLVKQSYEYIREEFNVKRTTRVAIIVTIFSTMCVIGIAGTAKSDAISWIYMLTMFIAINRYLNKGESEYFWIALIAGVMSYTVKYTSYLWGTLLFVIYGIVIVHDWFKKRRNIKWDIVFISIFGVSILILLGILYRTILITGVPFGRTAFDISVMLGFEPNNLFNWDTAFSLGETFKPNRLWTVLFASGQADKIATQWVGNYLLYFAIVSSFCINKVIKDIRKYNLILLMVINTISVYLLITMSYPDGNYFTIVILINSLIFMPVVFKNVSEFMTKCLHIVLILFIILNIMLNFVIHPSWNSGTRFSFEQPKLVTTQYDNYEKKIEKLKSNGLLKINEYLKENKSESFIILDSGDMSLMCMDARIEAITDLTNRYISAANIDSYEDFILYIYEAGVEGIILKNEREEQLDIYEYIEQFLDDFGYTYIIEDDKYTYYEMNVYDYVSDEKIDIAEGEIRSINGSYEDGWVETRSTYLVDGSVGEMLVINGLRDLALDEQGEYYVFINGIYYDSFSFKDATIYIEYGIEEEQSFYVTILSSDEVLRNEGEQRDLSWRLTGIGIQ